MGANGAPGDSWPEVGAGGLERINIVWFCRRLTWRCGLFNVRLLGRRARCRRTKLECDCRWWRIWSQWLAAEHRRTIEALGVSAEFCKGRTGWRLACRNCNRWSRVPHSLAADLAIVSR